MKGHVRKRGSKWCFVLDIGTDPTTGKRKQKWFSGYKTKKEAEKAMVDKMHELNQGAYIEPQKIKLGDYLLKWLNEYAKVNTAPLTFEGYDYIVNSHIVPSLLAKITLDKLKPINIQQYYTEKLENGKRDGSGGLSAKSVQSHHRLLHEALEHAVKWQIISINPTRAVMPPKPQKKQFNILTKDQIHILLKEAQNRKFYGPIYFVINTGMRRGEILGIRWKDVDFESHQVSVRQTVQRVNGKGIIFKDTAKTDGSRRTIAISESVIETLKKFKRQQNQNKLLHGQFYQDHDLVFTNEDGSPLDPDGLSRGFRRIVKSLDIPEVRSHDLRHSHATLLMQQGEHPKVISERLGHSSITITMDLYSHVMPNMQKEASQKLDDFLFGDA